VAAGDTTTWQSERLVYNGYTLIEERKLDSTLKKRYYYGEAMNQLIGCEIDQDADGITDGTGDQYYTPITDDRGSIMGVADRRIRDTQSILLTLLPGLGSVCV
jgi:hypothetical protein